MYSALCLSFLLVTSATFWQSAFAQTPVRVIAAAGVVATLTQILKKLYPAIAGKYAMLLNLVFSIATVLSATTPADFWTQSTWGKIVAIFAAAAGAHSTYRALRPGAAPGPDKTQSSPAMEGSNQYQNASVAVQAASQSASCLTGSAGSASSDPSVGQPIAKVVTNLALLALLGGSVMLTGCTDFERTTFNTLAASQAVINQAENDYEAKTIPQTVCAYAVINDSKAAQTAAVQAMVIYEQLKSAGSSLTAQTVTVTADLVTLPILVVDIKNLYTNPSACVAPSTTPAATSSTTTTPAAS